MDETTTFSGELKRRVWSCVWSVQVGLCLYGLLDFAMVAAQVSLPWFSWVRGGIVVLGLALPLAVLSGAVLAVVLTAGRRADDSLESPALPHLGQLLASATAALTLATMCAAVLLFTVGTFHRESLMALATTLVTMGAVVFAAISYRVVHRVVPTRTLLASPRWQRAAWIAAAVLWTGAIAVLQNKMAEPNGSSLRAVLLLPLAVFVGVVAYRAAGVRTTGGQRIRRPALATLGVTLLMPILALSPAGDDPALRHRLWQRCQFLMRAEGLLMPLLDRDRDGALAVFGGTDCNDGSAAQAPHLIEIADNGIDDDCIFGDMHTPPAAPPSTAPVPAPLAVLVTVSGLDGRGGRLTPALPRVEQELRTRARRYTRPVGVIGPFMHVAPVLITGRVPPAIYPQISAFPTGGDTLPAQVVRAGGRNHLSMPRTRYELNSHAQIADPGARRIAKTPEEVVSGAMQLMRTAGPGPVFFWTHFDLAQGQPGVSAEEMARRVDDSLMRLFAAFARQGGGQAGYRLLLVGLADQADGDIAPADTPGGPIALFGWDIPAGEADDIVGLFDVYPTLQDMLGVGPRAGAPDEAVPVPGSSLLRPRADSPGWRGYALMGRFVDGIHLGVVGPDGALTYDDSARVFRAAPGVYGQVSSQASWQLAHDARGSKPWVQDALTQLRERVLSPRRQARNRLFAATRNIQLPDNIVLTPELEIANTLRILGYTIDERVEQQIVVTLYLRGGEHLRPDDVLEYRLSWVQGAAIPGLGELPFGSWIPGAIHGERLVLDGRSLASAAGAGLEVGVRRNGKPLPLTGGIGHSGKAHVFTIDLSQ